MAPLNNPGLAGDVPFDTVIYASSGLNYAAVPSLVQYNIYDSPDPGNTNPSAGQPSYRIATF